MGLPGQMLSTWSWGTGSRGNPARATNHAGCHFEMKLSANYGAKTTESSINQQWEGRMILTASNVETIFIDCLFKDDEDRSAAIIAEGIVNTFGFHPDRLQSHKTEISGMLDELPDTFKQGHGGGDSFLNACMTNTGIQWGEHKKMEELLALGIATGQAAMLMPRNMWCLLPGGMPYFVVATEKDVSEDMDMKLPMGDE